MYQPTILTEEEGRELLKIARSVLEKFVRKETIEKPKKYSNKFDEVHGILCTLKIDSKTCGQGVVGLPFPLLSLLDAAMSSVISAAHEDPRFQPLKSGELNDVKIELSILTEPQIIQARKNEDLPNHIVPNTDGLMLRYGVYESFLPPQAWATIKDGETFLDTLCVQAGIEKETWRESGVELYKFQAQIFEEE